jgi:hypothetical protein
MVFMLWCHVILSVEEYGAPIFMVELQMVAVCAWKNIVIHQLDVCEHLFLFFASA